MFPSINRLAFKLSTYRKGTHDLRMLQTLKKYLAELSEMLIHADRRMLRPLNKSHVPQWAVAVFTACGVLLFVMALGYV